MAAISVFIADNGQGPELWRTDGTAAGTFALTTANPGQLIYLDGITYFFAADGNGPFGPQSELWRTDGTVAGTYALGLDFGSSIAQVGGKTYYIGSDASHREALFASDGVHQGVFVANLESNPSLTFSVGFVGSVGSDLLVEASNVLWISDGTSAGTHVLSDGEAGSSLFGASTPAILDGTAYFTATDGVNGVQLWETNGGAASVAPSSIFGTGAGNVVSINGELVFTTNNGQGLAAWDGHSASATPLFSGSIQFVTSEYFTIGNDLYFVSNDTFNTNLASAIYRTDGTVAGTLEVASGDFQSFALAGSRLVLGGSGAQGLGVYVSDGTAAGTTLALAATTFYGFVQVGAQVFFIANTDELWVSDGTVAGTHMLASGLSGPNGLTAFGNSLIFSASTDGTNREPWISDGTAAGTHVIANLHAENPGALTMADMGTFDGGLVFLGSTATTGNSIWVSNGTLGGTGVLVTPQPPNNFFLPGPFVTAGSNLYFVADTANGAQLWVASSATPGTTPGAVGADLDFENAPTFMTAFGGKLYFYEAMDGPQSFERFGGPGLFATDGTDAGTTLVSSATVLAQPIVFNNELLFFGSAAANGTGLFETDGTPGGTTFIAAVPSAVTPTSFTISGSQAFFVAGDASTGAELWVTDGTAGGTHLVEDLAPGAAGSSPSQLTAFNGGVVFDANGGQVWFSNGAAAGTFQLAINQTRIPSASLILSQVVQFNGKAYFVANDGTHGDQLWSSDGTAGGTSVVAQLSLTASQEQAFDFTILGSQLFFVDAGQPWLTDGTTAGTTQVTLGANFQAVDSTPVVVNGLIYFEASLNGIGNPHLFVTDGTTAGSHDLGVASFGQVPGFAVGGNFLIYDDGFTGFFSYNTLTGVKTFLASAPATAAFAINVGGQIEVGTPPSFGNTSLWVTDGTPGGTTQIASNPADTFTDYTSLGGKLYFLSFGQDNGLWVTSGTFATTQFIAGLSIQNETLTPIGTNLFFIATQSSVTTAWIYNTTSHSAAPISAPAVKSIPFDVTAVGTGAFFVADDATSQGELWHTTSTGAVVELTSATNGEVDGPNAPAPNFAVSGASLFFSGADSVHGQGLFISNGATTTFLATVSNPSDFSVIGGLLYFQGTDATNGSELWVSNGTAAGTHRLTDTEGAGSANASGFVTVGAEMFFSANDGIHGQELWKFNGQAGGAVMVADINAGAASSNPTQLTALGGDVYFVATGPGGSELWRSDGTAGGTVAITTASNGANPQDLTLDGAELFFFGSDSAHGAGLFVSNGAAGGTSFLGAFTAAADFTVQGGRLYFLGTNASGTELWTSDGTVAGTTVLSQTGVNPGSNPNSFITIAPLPHDDFNGDSVSDFLIRETSGAMVVGEVSNGAAGYTLIGALGSDWTFEGNGDFLGDGKTDVLVKHTSGVMLVGEVTGGQTTYTQVSSLGPTWGFEGTGDFLGGGKDGFLVDDSNSGTLLVGEVTGGQAVYTAVGNLKAPWTFQGTGDFLGDGKTDFLVQDAALAGVILVGEVVSGTATYTQVAGLGPAWTFVGTGDFLGDGKSDFLVQDAALGGAVLAGEVVGGQAVYTQIASLGAEWKFVGSGDYFGEGHDQFLIEDTLTGAVLVGDWNGSQTHYTQVSALGSDWTFH